MANPRIQLAGTIKPGEIQPAKVAFTPQPDVYGIERFTLVTSLHPDNNSSFHNFYNVI